MEKICLQEGRMEPTYSKTSKTHMEGERLGKTVWTFLFIQGNGSLFCLALSWVSEVCGSCDLTQPEPYLEDISKWVPRFRI